jgi:hypothetical protein
VFSLPDCGPYLWLPNGSGKGFIAIVYERRCQTACRRWARIFKLDGSHVFRNAVMPYPVNLLQTKGRFVPLIAFIDPFASCDSRWHWNLHSPTNDSRAKLNKAIERYFNGHEKTGDTLPIGNSNGDGESCG